MILKSCAAPAKEWRSVWASRLSTTRLYVRFMMITVPDSPSRTIIDLKDNYNFIESNDFENLNKTNRNNYILKIRKMLKKSPGINLKKDFRLNARRIKLLKTHKYI